MKLWVLFHLWWLSLSFILFNFLSPLQSKFLGLKTPPLSKSPFNPFYLYKSKSPLYLLLFKSPPSFPYFLPSSKSKLISLFQHSQHLPFFLNLPDFFLPSHSQFLLQFQSSYSSVLLFPLPPLDISSSQRLISLKTFRGSRLRFHYPSHGQRTH